MAKIKSQPNENVFKKVIRSVVKEEIRTEIDALEIRLSRVFYEINQKLDDKVGQETFRNYRDEVLTGLNKVVGELKTIREEQIIIGSEHGRIIDLEEKVEHLERMQFLHKKALQDE